MYVLFFDVVLVKFVEIGDVDGKDVVKEDCIGGIFEREVMFVFEGFVVFWRGYVFVWWVSVGWGRGGRGLFIV